MTKTKEDKVKETAHGIIGLIFLIGVGYFFFGGSSKPTATAQAKESPKQEVTELSSQQAQAAKVAKAEKEALSTAYAQKIKIALKNDFNYIDVHLQDCS